MAEASLLLRRRAKQLEKDAEVTTLEMVEDALMEAAAILEDAAAVLEAPALVDVDA